MATFLILCLRSLGHWKDVTAILRIIHLPICIGFGGYSLHYEWFGGNMDAKTSFEALGR